MGWHSCLGCGLSVPPSGRHGQGHGQEGSLKARPRAPVHIVVERVVTSQSNQGPQAQPVGEEDLGGGVKPHLRAEEQNLRSDQVQNCHRYLSPLGVLRDYLLCVTCLGT